MPQPPDTGNPEELTPPAVGVPSPPSPPVGVPSPPSPPSPPAPPPPPVPTPPSAPEKQPDNRTAVLLTLNIADAQLVKKFINIIRRHKQVVDVEIVPYNEVEQEGKKPKIKLPKDK